MADAKPVYALDFDGVICDSVGESSVSAYRTLSAVWPGLPGLGDGEPPGWLLSALRSVRPVVETGYENVLLARSLLEKGKGSAADEFVASALSGKWPDMRDALLDEWGKTKEELVEAFGSTRDAWIEEDVASWVSTNRFYPDVADALNFSQADKYIVTTKQIRFVELLLKSNGVTDFPSDRIYGLGSGTKISVLKKILSMPENAGRRVVFVEDRYETLEAVSISMLGEPLDLFLANWGYNTAEARETADYHPFINELSLPTFVGKFQ